MREIDERLLDQMLEHLRALNANVTDLYEKLSQERQNVARIQEQIAAMNRQIDRLEKGHQELVGSDTDRKIDRGTNALKWTMVGVLVTAIVVAIATGIVNMTIDAWNRNEGDSNEIQRTESTGE